MTVNDLQRFWKQRRDDHNLQNRGNSLGHEESHSNLAERADGQTHMRNAVRQGHNDLSNILKQLVKNGFVLRVRSAHLHTPADNYVDAQSYLLSGEDITTVKSRKDLEDLGVKVLEEVANRNDASISLADVIHAYSTGSKRPATDDSDSAIRKKMKLTNGASSSSNSAPSNCVVGHDPVAVCTLQVLLLPKLTFVQGPFAIRINHDKVAALLRNRRLIDKVRRTIGHSAAQAYVGVLEQSTAIPYRWQRRSEPAPEDEDLDASSHLIDQDSLLMALNTQGQHDDEDDDGIVYSAVSQGGSLTAGSHVHINGYVNGNHATETVRTVTLDDIKTQLLVLAQPPHKFVVQDPDSFRWTVDFRPLSAQLRREEAMRLAKSRLNSVALRLVRVLLDNGKLDEKTLQEKSLLSAKDLRQCLSKLKRNGFLGLQEVPREPQRQPLKTIYLWFYDSDRVRKMLLGDLYKAMARLLRRLKVERDKVGALLEKAERIDVRGKEEKFLARGEMEVLEEWRGKEEWLLGEVERLDDSVAILRDI